jgi:hypothetical protein
LLLLLLLLCFTTTPSILATSSSRAHVRWSSSLLYREADDAISDLGYSSPQFLHLSASQTSETSSPGDLLLTILVCSSDIGDVLPTILFLRRIYFHLQHPPTTVDAVNLYRQRLSNTNS